MEAERVQGKPIMGRMLGQGEFQLLSDLTQSINHGNTLGEVFDLIYSRLAEFVPYNRIAVAVADARKERLTILVAKSDGAMVLNKGYSGAIAGSSLEPLIRKGETRILNDLQGYLKEKPRSESTRLIVKEGMRSSLTVPLLVQGQPVGVMFFSSRQPQAYRPEHEAFIRNIVGHVSIAIEKSRLLDALRQRTDYLENILQSSADAIIVCDEKNRMITWNAGARQIFGFEESEALGKDYDLLVPPEERESSGSDRLKALVEKEGYLKNYECVRLTKDGRRITVNVTSTLLKDDKGRMMGRSSIVRDVTQLKKLQQEVVNTQSLAAVGQLAATVAHEIKNPLAGISGAVQVLQEAIPAQDRRREVVGDILEMIARLDNTVRDLLTFSRPASPARQEVDLKESIQRCWTLLSQQAGANRVAFELEGADGVRVSADPQLLHQVWTNLFQNAVEAMLEGGTLKVRVSAGAETRVEVSDTGGGIPESMRERLFHPFATSKTRGTGLGLAITKKNIEAHSGRIGIESGTGKGTTVTVEIPQ